MERSGVVSALPNYRFQPTFSASSTLWQKTSADPGR